MLSVDVLLIQPSCHHRPGSCQIQRVAPGIRLAGTFVLGGLGETEATIAAIIEFPIALGLDFARFYPLAIYPETPLFERICPPGSDPTAWATAMLAAPANFGENSSAKRRNYPAGATVLAPWQRDQRRGP